MMPSPFKCLAVETSTEGYSVAACKGDVVATRESLNDRDRSRDIFYWAIEVLAELELALEELDILAFGRGPGGFAGLRVAAAMVQGLGRGADLPVCSVSSLAGLAQAAAAASEQDVLVASCLDARMGQIYAGLYMVGTDDIREELADRLLFPHELSLREDAAVVAAGPGWSAHPDLQARLAAQIVSYQPRLLPQAASLLPLAKYELRAGRSIDAAQARPNYLRNQVTG